MICTYRLGNLGVNTHIKNFPQGVAKQKKWLADRYYESDKTTSASSRRFNANETFGLFKSKVFLCDLISGIGAVIVTRTAIDKWLAPVLVNILSPWSLVFAKIIIGLLLSVVVGIFIVSCLFPLLVGSYIFFYKQVRSFYGIKDSDIVRHGISNVPEQFVRLSRLSIPFQLEEVKKASRVSVGLLRNHLQLIPGSLTDRYALESAIAEFWYGCKTDQSHFRFIGLNKLRPLSNVASWMANLEYLMVADAALIGAAVGDESLLQNMRWFIEHVLQPEESSLFVSQEPVEMKIDRARRLANDRLLPTHADKFRIRYSHITDEEIFTRVQILHEIISTIRDLIRHETLGPALFALDASLPNERLLGPLSRT